MSLFIHREGFKKKTTLTGIEPLYRDEIPQAPESVSEADLMRPQNLEQPVRVPMVASPSPITRSVLAPGTFLEEIRARAASGDYIGAIKQYRAEKGADLREAKGVVDALLAVKLTSS